MKDSVPIRSGVFGDLTIYNAPLTREEFRNLVRYGKPNSYTIFKKYNQGDYTYEKAKFKIRINKKDAAIGKLEVIVDVPDIVDSGYHTTDPSLELYSKVTFEKQFNSIPHINISILGVTDEQLSDVYIEYGNVTKTYFLFKINSRDGETIPGTVSWIAKGY